MKQAVEAIRLGLTKRHKITTEQAAANTKYDYRPEK